MLPRGWEDRLVSVCNENSGGATGWCLEPADLAVSKLVAGRENDLTFVAALVEHRLAAPLVIRERLDTVDLPATQRQQIGRFLEGAGKRRR